MSNGKRDDEGHDQEDYQKGQDSRDRGVFDERFQGIIPDRPFRPIEEDKDKGYDKGKG